MYVENNMLIVVAHLSCCSVFKLNVSKGHSRLFNITLYLHMQTTKCKLRNYWFYAHSLVLVLLKVQFHQVSQYGLVQCGFGTFVVKC